MKTHTRVAWIGAAAIAFSFALVVPAVCQSQDDSAQSVAEAARKAKERKKAAAKEKTVITEDTLNLRPASADASGAPPAGTVVTSNPAVTPPAGTPAAPVDTSKVGDADTKKTNEKEKAEQAAEVAKTKELLAQAKEALDLLKRKLALDSDSFYTNPEHARDTNGKAKLDELQSMINEKQFSVDDLKAKLDDLLQKAGISSEDEKTPAPPQQ